MTPFRYGVCAAIAVALAALVGCNDATGGGSGGSAVPAPYTGPTVQVTGRVTYTRVPSLPLPTGLDYGNQVEMPIRGAVVEIRDASNRLVSYGNTDASGNYTLRAAQNQGNTLRVKAALGSPLSPNTYVVDADIADPNPPASDPLRGKALFVLDSPLTVVAADLTGQDVNAASGISSTGVFSASRPSGPFAILDVIYRAQALIRSADPGASFPMLLANWDTDLDGTDDASSFYRRSESALYIRGFEGVDLDEFDTHIVAHEWGHYFEHHFSRTDSLGGSHGDGDFLDDSIAFGEGFATGLAGMIMGDPVTHVGDPLYVENTATGGFSFDMELDDDTVGTGPGGRPYEGYWSENSVSEILYDIFDSAADAGDTVDLGFTPIYQAMRGGEISTPYFTSIFTFLNALEQVIGGRQAGIDALAAGENIGARDDHELTPGGRYLNILANGTTYAGTIQATYANGDAADFNKLFARVMIRAGLTASGRHRITVTPDPITAPIELRLPNVAQKWLPLPGEPLIYDAFPMGNDLIFSVGLEAGFTGRTIPFTVTVEPMASPIMPEGPG
ncbi:MAG TPA: hypothetical protein VEL07_03100 [Planctomycetota bacterium]|nr:hypothetical protein [Planctomycetota bacterium]